MEKVSDNSLLNSKQKLVRAGGIILFVGACGLALSRIAAYFFSKALTGMSEVDAEIVSNVFFTVLVQLISLFVGPFLVYKLYLKGKTKNFLTVSNVRPVSVGVCLLAVVVGVFAPVFSTLINLIVNYAFVIIGVSLHSSATILPEQFNFWVLLLNVVLTAVFPGICEEIFNRGIVLSGLRSMFSEWAVILLGGLVFGLFHQYIFQTFYTGAFGMVLVFITLKTKSTLPAMIIHFTNNFVAVIGEFASFYNWQVMLPNSLIAQINNPILLIFAILVGVAAFGFFVFLLIKCDKASKNKKIIKKLIDEGKIPQDVAKNKNVNVAGITVIGGPLGDVIYYKPTLKDTFLYWAAFALALVVTLSTLFWYMI